MTSFQISLILCNQKEATLKSQPNILNLIGKEFQKNKENKKRCLLIEFATERWFEKFLEFKLIIYINEMIG